MAVLYSGLKDNDQAIRWLQKAYEEHSGFSLFVKVDPFLDGLRSDARFTALLEKVHLEK
jgi:hypothetical protein